MGKDDVHPSLFTGMTGVAGGMVATLGMLNPSAAVLTQMGVAIGSGSLIGLGIAQRIKVS